MKKIHLLVFPLQREIGFGAIIKYMTHDLLNRRREYYKNNKLNIQLQTVQINCQWQPLCWLRRGLQKVLTHDERREGKGRRRRRRQGDREENERWRVIKTTATRT